MATSPDSVTPASAAYQLVRNLESAASGTRSACIINDAFPSTASDIALDCELLVLGSTDGVVTIWRLREDGSVDMVNGFVAHEGTIMDIVGSMHLVPDVDSDAFPCPGMECTALEASMTFYTCGRDHNIHRFSVSGDKIMTFKGHEDVVCSIHEFNSGNNLVSGSWDGSAIIWNCLTGAIQHRLRDSCYKYSVYCNSLPDGTVVTGMTNGDVCFWREGHLDKAVRGHDGVVRAVSVKDGTILSCANDCSVHIYSDALDLILPLPHAHENFIYDIRHSKNYSVFFTSSEDKSVKVWDLMTGQILQSLALETSVWKVIETRHHGIVVIPLNGNVTIWQLIPGTTPVTITSRSEDFGKPCDVETNKRSRAEGSFEMTRFQKANGAKAVERLMAFNESKSSDVVISEKDIALITSIFSAGKISYGDLTFVFKLIQWPAVERVPVFDFLKVLLLDPGCTTLYKGRNSGIQIYNCVCATLTDVEGNAPLATVSLQLLANMFVLTLPRNIALAHFDRTIQAINDGGAICQKMVQQAHSVCIENLIIACSDRTKDRSEKILGCLQSALYTLRRTKDAESWLGSVMLRHCRSLETLVYFDNKVPALLRKLGLLQMILDVAAEILPMKERRMVEESVDKLSQRIS